MQSSSLFTAAASLILLFGLSACSNAPIASPAEESPSVTKESAPTKTEDPDLPTNEDIETFVEAIASRDATKLQEAKTLVLENSNAAGYLTYQSHSTDAQIDAGYASLVTPETVSEIDGGFEMCGHDGVETFCTQFTDFEGRDGLISNFHVQGHDLSDRLSVGSEEIIEGPAGSEVEFVAAYMNARGTHLYVTFHFRSGSTEANVSTASYRAVDGRQSQAEFMYGAGELAPDSKSSYVALFPGATLGGEVYLDIWADPTAPPTTLTMPTISAE